jgi:hypothetical protein
LAEQSQGAYEQRHRELIDRLARELKPVRPLWPVPARLALWLALEALFVLLMIEVTKNDFMLKLAHPVYLLEVTLFAIAGILSAVLALRATIPGRAVRKSEITVAAGLVVAGILLLMSQPVQTGLPLNEFIGAGVRCACNTGLFALVPWLALWWAVRRGAPMNGAAEGALVGSGALLFSFALMRIGCPIDDELHLLTWHLVPALLLIGLSTIAGAMWLRFRPRTPSTASVTSSGS